MDIVRVLNEETLGVRFLVKYHTRGSRMVNYLPRRGISQIISRIVAAVAMDVL